MSEAHGKPKFRGLAADLKLRQIKLEFLEGIFAAYFKALFANRMDIQRLIGERSRSPHGRGGLVGLLSPVPAPRSAGAAGGKASAAWPCLVN